MYKKLLIFPLLFSLAACESMSPMGMVKNAIGLGGASSKGVDVDTNIGKEIKDEDNVVKVVGETTDIKAEKIEGGVNKIEGHSVKADKVDKLSFTTIQSMPFEMQLLMILGWIMPSPASMWNGFLNLLPWRKKKNEHS